MSDKQQLVTAGHRPRRSTLALSVSANLPRHANRGLTPVSRAAAIAIALSVSCPAAADTFVVTNTRDAGPGSFRQAVLDANASPGMDTVVLSSVSGTIGLTSGPIYANDSIKIEGPARVQGDLWLSYLPELYINRLEIDNGSLSISGAKVTIVDSTISNSPGAGIYLSYLYDMTIRGTTITGSRAAGIWFGEFSGGAKIVDSVISDNGYHGIHNADRASGGQTIRDTIISGNGGAGIAGADRTIDSVFLYDSTISNNRLCGVEAVHAHVENSVISGNRGCGVDVTYQYYEYTYAGMSIRGSTVSGNQGGGVRTGQLYIENSVVENNVARSCAGLSILNGHVIDSTISGNQATGGAGGGLCLGGAIDPNYRYDYLETNIVNRTIAKNSALTTGGGIHASDSNRITVKHSTITGNRAQVGGGVYRAAGTFYEQITLRNTIVAGNHAVVDPDISSRWAFNLAYSLIKEPDTAQIRELVQGSNILGQAALLDVFQDNGGGMNTHALKANSPARDAGDPAIGRGGFDQRGSGYARVVNGRIDMGAIEVQGEAQIGDLVWADANGNGIQDSGESGKPDVTVRLRDCTGKLLVSARTKDNGQYRFKGLAAGSHQVEFVAPDGFGLSPSLQGDRRGRDSDPDPASGLTDCRFLADGRVRLGVDAGLVRQPTGTAAIGDRVWRDVDGDGIQESGEPGEPGVPVRLLDCDGKELMRAVSAADGGYRFAALGAGRYRIGVVPPPGFSLSPARQGNQRGKDSDPDPATGQTSCLGLRAGQLRAGVDVGLIPEPVGTGRIGDYVWRDRDGDGHQDNNEVGLAQVRVQLLACDGQVLQRTTTDAEGRYVFDELTAGRYRVRFRAPSGLSFSPAGQSRGGKDSDPNPNTGTTACKPLAEGQSRLGIDAGLN